MFVPRTFIIAGIVLIAISLGAAGHGFWWLIGLVWAFGWMHNGRHACRVGRESHRRHDHGEPSATQAREPVGQPDPTHDRHEAFPAR